MEAHYHVSDKDTGRNSGGGLIKKCKYKIVSFIFLDVCFVRLDFTSFTIMGPADTQELTGGACATDVLTITVSSIYYSLLILGPVILTKVLLGGRSAVFPGG